MRTGKTLMALALILVLVALFVSGCATSGETGVAAKEKTYAIGAPGPARGVVFYDKGEVSDGWRYLEMAPDTTERLLPWGFQGSLASTRTAVGSGRTNTEALVIDSPDMGTAATYCAQLVVQDFSDWFLPSKDELDLLYTSLARNGTGTFLREGYGYWSSSEYDERRSWGQGFSNGVQGRVEKAELLAVRAIRAF